MSRIVAICPVRNEGWIAGLSIRAMMLWADHVIALDHCSTDETPDILTDIAGEYPGRLTVLTESGPVWEEMRHRQRLLDTARKNGATHVCIIDADEILSGDLLEKIRPMVEACPAGQTMQLPWLCLRNSKDLVHRSGVWGEQQASMAFVDNPGLFWSSEGRASYDFHHRAPMGRTFAGYRPLGSSRKSGLLHFQMVNAERLRAKQFHYVCTELSRWPGRETPDQVRRKYSLSIYGREYGPALDFDLAACPFEWLEPYQSLMRYYRPAGVPWQLQAAREIIAANPGMDFGGDDFGTGLLADC